MLIWGSGNLFLNYHQCWKQWCLIFLCNLWYIFFQDSWIECSKEWHLSTHSHLIWLVPYPQNLYAFLKVKLSAFIICMELLLYLNACLICFYFMCPKGGCVREFETGHCVVVASWLTCCGGVRAGVWALWLSRVSVTLQEMMARASVPEREWHNAFRGHGGSGPQMLNQAVFLQRCTLEL